MNKKWTNMESTNFTKGSIRRPSLPPAIEIQRELFPNSVMKRNYKVDNLKSIQIENFKSIVNETLELRTGTFLSGFNSAGKSSFSQALLLVLQWLENLSSGQPGRVPINGPLIQLGTSAESILNRAVKSKNNDKSPSVITFTWSENEEFTQIIVFKLSTNQSTTAEFQLEEVSITQKINKNKNIREKEWKYKFQNNKIITNSQRAVGWFINRKIYGNSHLSEKEGLKILNHLQKLNEIEKNPYFVIKEIKNNTHRRKYLFHPSEVNITENIPSLPSGFENIDPNLDSSLVSREDSFKFLIFKKFCQILLDTPLDLDQEFQISQMLYQLRNKKINLPQELTEDIANLDLFNFDLNQNFIDNLQEKLEDFKIIDLDFKLSDYINKDLQKYVEENKLLREEEFIPNDKESYIDSINFAELLNLYNITAHQSFKSDDISEFEKQIRFIRRYRKHYEEANLREFYPEELLTHLDVNNVKKHKSIWEGDAFADELVDLLSSELNLINIATLSLSGMKQSNEEVKISDLVIKLSKAIRSHLYGTGEQEGVFEIYEKQQSITNIFPKKAEASYINFQQAFINNTKDLDNEIDELLHEQSTENEISKLNEELKRLDNDILLVKEDVYKEMDKRQLLLEKTLSDNDDEKLNKDIREKIIDLNKKIETRFEHLTNLETRKKATVSDLGKLNKDGKNSEIADFSYFISDFDKLEKLIEQKARNIFKEIMALSESNIKKIETYTLLKLLVPNFLHNKATDEYQEDLTSNLTILEVDNSKSIKDLIDSKKFVILPKEQVSNSEELSDSQPLFSFRRRRDGQFTFFDGNTFYSDFNFLSATRNVSNLNNGRYYGGNNISPLGSNAEFLANYLNIHKKDKYLSPLPQSYLDNLDQKGLSDNALYELTLSQHIDIWSSFIFGNELKIDIDDTSGLNLMVGEDTIENVGSGINQVLPIIVQLIISKGKMLILEEAEQNLHPQAQANLADMIITFAKHGRKILVETHSDHLINRLRLRIVENADDKNDIDILIYFTEIDQNNGTKLVKMDINNKGEFITDKIPDGFFDQPQKDTIQILKALKAKKT